MDARDPTPPKGENVTGESFPQYCLRCQSEWRILGRLDDDDHRECPGCQLETPPTTFFQWWVTENLHTAPEIEVEVSPEVSAAVDVLEEATDTARYDLLADIVSPQWRVVERE